MIKVNIFLILAIFGASFVISLFIMLSSGGKKKSGLDNTLKNEKKLEEIFGGHVYIDSLTLEPLMKWLKSHLHTDNKSETGMILKITKESLKKIGLNIHAEYLPANYLAVVIMDESRPSEIIDSLLVRYENIDDKLEDFLQKGDGCLVIKE